MDLSHFPNELQNKIFYYYAVHPSAELIKAKTDYFEAPEGYFTNTDDIFCHFCHKRLDGSDEMADVINIAYCVYSCNKCDDDVPEHIQLTARERLITT